MRINNNKARRIVNRWMASSGYGTISNEAAYFDYANTVRATIDPDMPPFRTRAESVLYVRNKARKIMGLPPILAQEIKSKGSLSRAVKFNKLSSHLQISPNTQRANINHDLPKRLPRSPSEPDIRAFYETWDWKRLRYDFIKDRQRRCQCCGATPESGIRIVVDHIKPIRKYWHLRLDRANLQILCDDCNMGKGSRDETNWSNVVPFKK